MACDIHCYIEYKDGDRFACFGGRINPGRNYRMFEVLAGVRTDDPLQAIVPPRGLPHDISTETSCDAFLCIGGPETHGWVGWCTLESATRWGGRIEYRDGKPYKTANPDWHSHTWLTPDEFESAIDKVNEREPEYRAILAALRSFEDMHCMARLVFWFDN